MAKKPVKKTPDQKTLQRAKKAKQQLKAKVKQDETKIRTKNNKSLTLKPKKVSRNDKKKQQQNKKAKTATKKTAPKLSKKQQGDKTEKKMKLQLTKEQKRELTKRKKIEDEVAIMKDYEVNKNSPLHEQLLARFKDKSMYFIMGLKPGSLKTYMSNKNMVVNRISYATKERFPYSFAGILDFLLDPKVSNEVSNLSCRSILSTYRTLYKIQYHISVPAEENDWLDLALAARMNIVPETGRIMGAVNRVRLYQLLDFLEQKRKNNEISEEEKIFFKDISITLYCGALRIFQTKDLTRNSFDEQGGKENYIWISVPIKGNQSSLEHKVLDPETQKEMLEIIKRRSNNNKSDDALFPEFIVGHEKRIARAEEKLKELCQEAGEFFTWPEGHHFQGTHMFRHGAVQDAVKEKGNFWAKLRSGHETEKCLKIYAATDAERNYKLQLMKMNNEQKNEFLEGENTKIQNFYDYCARQKKVQPFQIKPVRIDLSTQEMKAKMKNCKLYEELMMKNEAFQKSMRDKQWVDDKPPENKNMMEEIRKTKVSVEVALVEHLKVILESFRTELTTTMNDFRKNRLVRTKRRKLVTKRRLRRKRISSNKQKSIKTITKKQKPTNNKQKQEEKRISMKEQRQNFLKYVTKKGII